MILLNRFLIMDDLFFEGLGLWQGEGSKSKGLYFGNSCTEIVLHFLKFVENKLGLERGDFKVVVLVPDNKELEQEVKEKWSSKLGIPLENFKRVCFYKKINYEHAMLYINSIVLITLFKTLAEHLKPLILSNKGFAAVYLRGIFAAEGSVIIKKSGALFNVDLSAKGNEEVRFYKEYLDSLGVEHGKYTVQGMKFPIHGHSNFERFREFGLHTLHPDKSEKFERGFASYKRINVLDGEEARTLILQQLASGPKTYDDLAAALGKARTTVQAHHIPILEREGRIMRAGKRGQSWLWALTQPNQIPTHDTILKLTIMAT